MIMPDDVYQNVYNMFVPTQTYCKSKNENDRWTCENGDEGCYSTKDKATDIDSRRR